MVESYYPNMIPIFCFNDENNPYPYLKITVKRKGKGDLLLSYTDIGITPILIPKKTYDNGDIFTVIIQYSWNGSPANDYTFSVYSKSGNLKISDSLLYTN